MNKLEQYIVARWAYAMGTPIISDMEYNRMHKELSEEFPFNEYVLRPWSEDPCPVELLRRCERTDLIKAVEIVHSTESIPSITTEEEFKNEFGSTNCATRVSMKLDGWNTEVNYYNGKLVSVNTRGRTGSSKDAFSVSGVFPSTIALKGRVKVIGETTISKAQWDKYQALTGNVSYRASLATAIANGDGAYLNFKAFNIQSEHPIDFGGRNLYQYLQDLGFGTPKCMYASNFDSLSRVVDILGNFRDPYPLFSDGLVIENDFKRYALRIRAWGEAVLHSYVTGYEEKDNAHRIAMVVTMKPITGETATYSRLDVDNLNTIVENNLQIGYPVAFNIRSGVNPVLDVSGTAELQAQWKGRYEEYRKQIDRKES